MAQTRFKKPSKRQHSQGQQRRQAEAAPDVQKYESQAPSVKRDTSPIAAKTDGQRKYLNAIRNFAITIATGPAGTGKSFLATSYAAQELAEGAFERLIIARPAVEAGEKMGFLPGEIADKFSPYLVPYLETLHKRLGKGFTEYLIKIGRIEAVPFAYMRGRTFDNALILLDEAQNTTPEQMKLFLTRIGEDSKMIVNGDTKQLDISGMSGLEDAVKRLSFIPSLKHVHMTSADIVRSPLCREIVECYERD